MRWTSHLRPHHWGAWRYDPIHCIFLSLVYLWALVTSEIHGFLGSPDAVNGVSHCCLASFYLCVLNCQDIRWWPGYLQKQLCHTSSSSCSVYTVYPIAGDRMRLACCLTFVWNLFKTPKLSIPILPTVHPTVQTTPWKIWFIERRNGWWWLYTWKWRYSIEGCIQCDHNTRTDPTHHTKR